MPVPPKVDPPKDCEMCGAPLVRKRFASGRLEDRTVFLKRTHCSQQCANSRKVIQLDSHRWRARQIERQPTCQDCGGTNRLHVHHIDRDPANNQPANLTTLCASCHLRLHWREDREQRVAAARTGAITRRLFAAGNGSSAARLRVRHKSALAVDPNWTPAFLNS